MSEKRRSRVLSQPKGTLSYTVDGSDTLASIAALYDTTTSDLKRLNRLMNMMIFPGQVLYVPDKDYVATPESSPAVSPTEKKDFASTSPPSDDKSSSADAKKHDIPVIGMRNKPAPGHAERTSSTTASKTQKTAPKKQLSKTSSGKGNSIEDAAKKMDEECMERFLKIRAKYITDGQGVVSGVLLVTPNAIMFDPNPNDPLIVDQGSESYGMIAQMETILSACMYHDIAAMKTKIEPSGKTDDPTHPQHKSSVYHSAHCPARLPSAGDGDDTAAEGDKPSTGRREGEKVVKDQHLQYKCSCGAHPTAVEDKGEEKDKEEGGNKYKGKEEGKKEKETECGEEGAQKEDTPHKDEKEEEGKKEKGKEEEGNKDSTSTPPKEGNIVVEGAEKTETTESHDDSVQKEEEDTKSPKSPKSAKDSVTKDNEDEDEDVFGDFTSAETDNTNTKVKKESKESKEDDDDDIFSMENEAGMVDNPNKSANNDKEQQQQEDETDHPQAEGSDTASSSAPEDRGLFRRTLGSVGNIASSIGSSFPNSPNMTNFVNFSSGLFKVGEDKEKEEEKENQKEIAAAASLEARLVDRPDLFKTLDELLLKTHQRLDLVPRPAMHFEDPPLYLCLKIGQPQKVRSKNMEYSVRKITRAEYWFSIPHDKVDLLYAFFVQWSPNIYDANEEEIDPEKQGFVVVLEDEDIDFNEDYFTGSAKMSKNWEIVNKQEARRRISECEEDYIPPPELLDTSTILNDEHLAKLGRVLLPRAEGYPWSLIYSTDKHGFSLKTMYRAMTSIDSPVILVVKDTVSQVFGAMLSVPLKLSDHFYGTGESFLWTFYPTFKKFQWTGRNSLFAKGNTDGLCIGAGEGSFGLWLDNGLNHGRSQKCQTYENDILTEREDFMIKAVEVWGFID